MKTALVLFMGAVACCGQGRLSVVLPNELAEQREAIEKAWAQWQAGDKHLERDLLVHDAKDVLHDIEHGERSADEYFQQRSYYLKTLIGDLRGEIRDLTSKAPADTFGLHDDDENSRLKQVLQEQLRLADAHDPTGVPEGARRLDRDERSRESEALKQLAEKVDTQKRMLHLLADNEHEQVKVRDSLVSSYRKVTSLLEDQVRINEAKKALWGDYYESLRKIVQTKVIQTSESETKRTKKE